MNRSPRERILYLLSIVFAAAPLVFAFIRARQTHGTDLRMLWMALVALAGASAVMLRGKARSRATRNVLALSALALVIATLLAVATAFLLGAKAGPGAFLVALVLSFCWATSFALHALSRPGRLN